jgi:biofilm PGA synthesis protein PgaD
MNAPLKRTAPARPLIIDRPELVPVRSRVTFGALTIVFWLVWAYLWSPLLTLAGWGVGLYLGYTNLAPDFRAGRIWPILLSYLAVIVALGALLLGWASIQWARFRTVDRRAATDPVSAAELAVHPLIQVGLDESSLLRWQRSRRLVVTHDEHGRVTGAEEIHGAPVAAKAG